MTVSHEDQQASFSARFADLKTALALAPDQERNWPRVEEALAAAAQARIGRAREVQQLHSKSGLDLEERMRDRAKGLRSRAEHVEQLADAAATFLNSLDVAQTRRLGFYLRSSSRDRQARRSARRASVA